MDTNLLRLALKEYDRSDIKTHAALLAHLETRVHNGDPARAFILVYRDVDQTIVDVEQTLSRIDHWFQTGESSPVMYRDRKDPAPVYRIGEARRRPRTS